MDQQQQQQQQQQNPSEMQKLQSRLGEIYSTDAFLDPTPIHNETSASHQRQQYNEEGSDDDSIPEKVFRTLKRENSLKMESVFDSSTGTVTLTDGKKKFDASVMSMSGTSLLSMGDFGDEGELSSLFDTSMKITPGNYVVGLNDRGNRSRSNSLSPKRGNMKSSTPTTGGSNNKDKNSAALLGMSLATIEGAATAGEKSTSSMSCDSSLSRLFEESSSSVNK
jgi:hypothetical protein